MKREAKDRKHITLSKYYRLQYRISSSCMGIWRSFQKKSPAPCKQVLIHDIHAIRKACSRREWKVDHTSEPDRGIQELSSTKLCTQISRNRSAQWRLESAFQGARLTNPAPETILAQKEASAISFSWCQHPSQPVLGLPKYSSDSNVHIAVRTICRKFTIEKWREVVASKQRKWWATATSIWQLNTRVRSAVIKSYESVHHLSHAKPLRTRSEWWKESLDTQERAVCWPSQEVPTDHFLRSGRWVS